MITRMFKRVNLLGLDFYVDWIDETGEFIAIKEVHSGKRLVFEGLMTKEGSLWKIYSVMLAVLNLLLLRKKKKSHLRLWKQNNQRKI